MSTNVNDAAPKLPPKPARELARVLFDYEAQNEDELTIKTGETITIISKDNEDAGWWKGELNGRTALFPDNFVEIIVSSAPPPLPAELDKAKLKKPDRSSSIGGSVANTALATKVSTAGGGVAINKTHSTTVSSTLSGANKTLEGNNKTHDNVVTAGSSNSPNNNRKSFVGSNTTSTPIAAGQHLLKKLGLGRSSTPTTTTTTTNSNGGTASNEPVVVANGNTESKNDAGANNSAQKLVHLTTQRPKIPTNNRRPPSVISSANNSLVDDGDGSLGLALGGASANTTQDQSSEESSDNEASSTNEPNGRANGAVAAVRTRSGAKAAEELPYLREMRLKQEAKRNSELLQQNNLRKEEDNASHDNLIAHKKSAPPPPVVGTKPQLGRAAKPGGFVASAISSSSSSSSQQQPAQPTTSAPTTPEVSVSNLKNKFVPTLNTNNNISLNKSSTTVATTPSPSSTPTTKLASSQSMPSTSAGTPLTPKVALKKPVSQNVAAHTLEDFQKLYAELKEMKEEFKNQIESINAQHDATVSIASCLYLFKFG